MLTRRDHGLLRPWSEKKDGKVEDELQDFVPRDYQIEMLNRAKQENTIVMMPTGSGKTYVAVLVVKNYLHQVMTDPWKIDFGGSCAKGSPSCGSNTDCTCGDKNWKRTFFLVNQVTLVTQQAKVLEQHTGVSIGLYSGSHSNNIDTWDKLSWCHEFKKNQILVMTAQIFLNLLSCGHLSTNNVNVLVLDECHHAKENHTYAVIMRDYWRPKKAQGRVIGLTASVIDKKKINGVHQLEATIEKLQKMLNSRLVTPREFTNQLKDIRLPDPDMIAFSHGAYGEELIRITDNLLKTVDGVGTKSLPEQERSTFSNIKKIVTSVPEVILQVGVDSLSILLNDSKGMIVELRNYLSHPNIAPLQSSKESCKTFSIGEVLLNQLIVLKKTVTEVIDNSREKKMSIKFLKLIETILELQFGAKNNETPRIIIFVERRRVVLAMYKYMMHLRAMVESCGNLKVSYVLGGTSGGSALDKLSDFESHELNEVKKQQDQALLDFREGKSNILIATSVVEEGLDIPSCNVVIRYDFPQTYRAFVQSRGRARKSPAKFIFFVSQYEIKEKQNTIENFAEIEILLKKFASEENEKYENDDSELEEIDYNQYISPLEVEESGAKVTAVGAIQRLHFYCSQLPKDEYTSNMPENLTDKVLENMFTTTISLPKLCPVKEDVIGDPMPNAKLAKMSAAMKALIKLYDVGELTDCLLPQFRQKEVNPLLIMGEEGRSSTVDQKLKIPSTFWRKNLGEPDGTFYLYSIRMSLSPTCPEEFHEYFNSGKDHKVVCFGILSKEELPKFPIFDVYPRFGTVTVGIIFERKVCVPVHVLQNQYYWFQEAIFSHLLDVNSVKLFPGSLFKDYFIVPLSNKPRGPPFRSKTSGDSESLDVDARFITQLKKQWDATNNHWIYGNMPKEQEKCLDSVIFPAYLFGEHHNNLDVSGHLYVVIKISELTAQDKLKGRNKDEDITYEQYHLEHKQFPVRLEDPTKNLLECRYVTRHYDFLHSNNKNASTYNKRKANMVAELQRVHPMPASLWNQASCLPAILWRLETFLLSHELSCEIFRDQVGQVDLLASNHSMYFKEHCKGLKQMLRRDKKYEGAIDWLETLHALTHKSCQEHYNLERLEFLGDRFLKLVGTLFYYRTMTDKHEGWLSKYRSQLVCNQNLAVRASRSIHLPRFILNKKVDPKKHWIPPCFLPTHVINRIQQARDFTSENFELYAKLQSNQAELVTEGSEISPKLLKSLREASDCIDVHKYLQNKTVDDTNDTLLKLCELIPDDNLQQLGTKDTADSMEALLGLVVSRYGFRHGVDLLDRIQLTTFQSASGHSPVLFKDHLYKCTPRSQIHGLPPHVVKQARSRCSNLNEMSKRTLNYTFRDPLYLLEALTHASYRELDTCYQRLEYLGDAVLDVLMVFHIFEDKPQYDQGKMSDLLSSLVCNTTLSKICTQLKLHNHLLYESPELYNVLARFYSNFDENQLKEWCSDLSLERVFIDAVKENDTPDRIHILDLDSKIVETPKLLGDLLESVIGAIYLDCGEDMDVVWRVIWPWFEPFYTPYSASPPKNPKVLVNEQYPGLSREVISYPGDDYRCIATIAFAVRGDETRKYAFKTIGRDRDTALEVSYGRAWHFHKRFLAQSEGSIS